MSEKLSTIKNQYLFTLHLLQLNHDVSMYILSLGFWILRDCHWLEKCGRKVALEDRWMMYVRFLIQSAKVIMFYKSQVIYSI